MSSLIIKITQDGKSQEYLFDTLGPIIIGSDKKCDLWLDDSQIESKLLEVKVSAGNIFVKKIGARGGISINSIIPAFRHSTHYHEGECICVNNTNYQITISKSQTEVIEPPPFFESEFKERLERMNLKIREKEFELKNLDASSEKKQILLEDITNKYFHHSDEKNKLELEVSTLRAQKETISKDILQSSEKNQDELQKVDQLRDFLKRLEDEERTIKDKILVQNLALENLKVDRENRSKEVDLQRNSLNALQVDTLKMKEQLRELSIEYQNQEKEIHDENIKIQKILTSSDIAMKEGTRIQGHIAKTLKDKVILDYEYKDLHEEVQKLEFQRIDAQNKLHDLRVLIDQDVINAKNIQEGIQRQGEEEKHLTMQNGELRVELMKVEEKLSLKKNQLNLIDSQNQDVIRKLSTVNFELERSSFRLKEINSEERTQELKMQAIREELQSLSRKAALDKKAIAKSVEDEKFKLTLVSNALLLEIEEQEKIKVKLSSEHELLNIKIEKLETKHRSLTKEKASLESIILELRSNKSQFELQIDNLKNETVKLEHEKNRAHRELSQTQIKLLDCEPHIKEKLGAAHLEIENYKRDERSRLLAEKDIFLIEVEAYKQTSLIELESEYRRQQDDIHQIKSLAQEQANAILQVARRIEAEITQEAGLRLKEATLNAEERESLSHKRILEAQEYFKQKEIEADSIINKARFESRDLMKNSESQLLEDLAKRKQKIKKFLTMKQETGTAHLKSLNDQAIIRMKRNEEKANRKLEDLKRRELKKVAKIREVELSLHNELKVTAMKEFKLEKEKTQKQILELKNNQEAELALKKKSVIDHISSIKFDSQKTWKEELKREKESFQMTKKNRIANATQAVMNVLIAETGTSGESELHLREKIHSTLKMAIDGQSAHAINEVGQILDFNPEKRKNIIAVLKKYSINFGIPAAIAITLLADIGSVRTMLVGQTKELMKQNHLASEMNAKQQKSDWKEKHSFNPALTPGYKTTFTDNIIYTTDFEKIMDNEEFQNDWILKIHDFMVKDLELPEDIAINYISSEGALIKELSLIRKDLHPQYLNQGLKKMKDQEETHLGWLKQKIVTPQNMERFTTFRKNYFDKFYDEKFKANRNLATEKK